MADFEKRCAEALIALSDRRVVIELTGVEAWCLVSQVQLASRHPANTGWAAEIAFAAARRLQHETVPAGDLAALAEMGWNAAHDVTAERSCRICGCTDRHACVADNGRPCHWVEADLCSACTDAAPTPKVR